MYVVSSITYQNSQRNEIFCYNHDMDTYLKCKKYENFQEYKKEV